MFRQFFFLLKCEIIIQIERANVDSGGIRHIHHIADCIIAICQQILLLVINGDCNIQLGVRRTPEIFIYQTTIIFPPLVLSSKFFRLCHRILLVRRFSVDGCRNLLKRTDIVLLKLLFHQQRCQPHRRQIQGKKNGGCRFPESFLFFIPYSIHRTTSDLCASQPDYR